MNKIKRSGCALVGMIFILLIFWQHRYVYMYFDDYGYASLSYGWNGNIHGMSYTLKDIISYLKFHYMCWGGRIQFLFYEIVLFRIGGLRLIQVVQAAIITLICVECGRITAKMFKCESVIGISIMFVLYGLSSVEILRDGVYWYSASVLYIWPLLPFFCGLNIMLSPEKSTASLWKIVSCCLFFLAAFSQEQIAVMSVVTAGGCTGVKFLNRKKDKEGAGFRDWIGVCISTLFGAALCIFAPGNFARANSSIYDEFYAQGFIKRTAINCARILNNGFGKHNWLLVCVCTLFIGSALYSCIKRKEIIFMTGLFMSCFLAEQILSIPLVLSIAVRAVWAFVFMLALAYFLVIKEAFILLILLLAGICSQGMMLVSPSVSVRCYSMFGMVLNVILSYVMLCVVVKEKNPVPKRGVFCKCFLIFLLAVSVINSGYIIKKYKDNSEILQINHTQMIEAKEQEKQGPNVQTVMLYKLQDEKYANIMPYTPGYEFIEVWMKKYYEVQDDLKINWVEAESGDTLQAHDL